MQAESSKMSNQTLPRPICIIYRRLPDDVREFPGVLRKATSRQLIIESPVVVSNPRQISGKVIADSGYLAIWFIFKDKWYDVGKFYDRARKWIGYYCDIVKPVNRLLSGRSRTAALTDLFLDLWITPEGRHFVLDEDELQNALERGHISRPLANQAHEKLASLIQMLQDNRFPPPAVRNIEPLRRESQFRS